MFNNVNFLGQPRKRLLLAALLMLAGVSVNSCKQPNLIDQETPFIQSSSTPISEAGAKTPYPEIFADTFFSGYAFLDTNQNGKLDSDDSPLEGATFLGEGFGMQTDRQGYAMILIPGEWDKPVITSMKAPMDSGLTLISPAEVVLQDGVKNRADFLFSSLPERPTQSAAPLTSTPVLIDLIYCTTDDGVQLTMDLYQPQAGSGPFPAVLYVHGGGWTSGDKTDGTGLFFREELIRRGYIFASINYRLAPKYSFPAPILDVKCAVRALRARAKEFNLDPQRIGALGGSAGGQLVALLGTAGDVSEWESGEYSDQSSWIGAVVDMFGPTDLRRMYLKSERQLFLRIFGASSGDDPILTKFSPVSYIDPEDPPFLILHGDQDLSVPLEQSQLLYNALIDNQVPVEMIVVKNAGHSFLPVGGRIKPSMLALSEKVGDFFDQYLK